MFLTISPYAKRNIIVVLESGVLTVRGIEALYKKRKIAKLFCNKLANNYKRMVIFKKHKDSTFYSIKNFLSRSDYRNFDAIINSSSYMLLRFFSLYVHIAGVFFDLENLTHWIDREGVRLLFIDRVKYFWIFHIPFSTLFSIFFFIFLRDFTRLMRNPFFVYIAYRSYYKMTKDESMNSFKDAFNTNEKIKKLINSRTLANYLSEKEKVFSDVIRILTSLKVLNKSKEFLSICFFLFFFFMINIMPQYTILLSQVVRGAIIQINREMMYPNKLEVYHSSPLTLLITLLSIFNLFLFLNLIFLGKDLIYILRKTQSFPKNPAPINSLQLNPIPLHHPVVVNTV